MMTGNLTEQRIEMARQHLDAHLDRPLTLVELGRAVGMSPYYLQRVFKQYTGLSPKDYVHARRIDHLKSRLKAGETVTSATYEAGYGASSRLYEQSNARLGMTPSVYRRGGAGMHIRFTIVSAPLGRLLVGATERGVCSVMLGDTDGPLEQNLKREYPHAEISNADEKLRRWVQSIVEHLQGASDRLSLPLDVRGTAFQWQVWRALQDIPFGSTRSYSEIAATLGRPHAVRAVARACASNRVAIVVPCHRAVEKNGKLGGYRWGVGRKRQLLEQEKSHRP